VQVKHIPSSQVLAIVKQRLRLSTENYDGFLNLELELILQNIYSPAVYNSYERVVEVCDSSFKVAGAKRLWGVQLCRNEGTDSSLSLIDLSGAFFMLYDLAKTTVPVYGGCLLDDYVVYQDGYWKFHNETDELYAKVWYEGFAIDDEGFVLIPENYQSFLGNELCSRFLTSFPNYMNNNPNLSLQLARTYNRKASLEYLNVNGQDQQVRADETKNQWRFANSKIRMNSPYWSGYAFNRI